MRSIVNRPRPEVDNCRTAFQTAHKPAIPAQIPKTIKHKHLVGVVLNASRPDVRILEALKPSWKPSNLGIWVYDRLSGVSTPAGISRFSILRCRTEFVQVL